MIEDSSVLFETSRLTLRRVAENDRDIFLRLFCDTLMMQFLGGPWTVQQAEGALIEWREEWGKQNYYYGMISLKSSGDVVGIAGISEDTNPEEPGIEFSWFVLPEHQKQGYASEITQTMLEHVFVILKKERLFAETHPENIASNRVLEKLGFTNAGERHHQYESLPGFQRQVVWEFTREEYKKDK